MVQQSKWDWELKADTLWLNINVKELYQYKDLLFRLTRKEFLGLYQQTLLGPFWILLQPLLTVLTYVLIFNNVIGISTNGTPPFLFNLIGITLWNFFSEIFLGTSKTFTQNAAVFSKVYFPRIIAALSALWLQCILFGVQLLFLFAAYIFYLQNGSVSFTGFRLALMLPAAIITAGIAFGAGLIFSVLTAKYRDLLSLITLMIRLLMFICPIFYSLQMVPNKVKWLVGLNPLAAQFEEFRLAFIGNGGVSAGQYIYSVVFMLSVMTGGILIFNKMGDKLMDVI